MRIAILHSILFLTLNAAFPGTSPAQTPFHKRDSLLQEIEGSQPQKQIGLYLQLASRCMEEDPEKTLQYSQKAHELSMALEQHADQARSRLMMGKACLELDRYGEAATHLAHAATHYKKRNEKEQLEEVFFRMGEAYNKLGIYEKSDSSYQQALLLSQEKNNPSRAGQTYNKLGLNQKENNAYSRANAYHRKALDIFKREQLEAGRANTLNYLGSIHWQQGRYDSARHYYHQSLELKEQLGDTLGMIHTLNNLALVQKNTGQYQKAIELHQQAHRLASPLDRPLIHATTFNYIGNVHLKIRQFDRALLYYRRSLSSSSKKSDLPMMARSHNNMALVYKSTEQYDSALVHLKKSLEIRRQLGNQHLISRSLNNIGSVYYRMSQYDQALNHYLQALEIRNEAGDQEGVAASLSNIGSLYQSINSDERALQYYNQSLKIKQNLGLKKDVAYTLHIIGNSYLHLKKYDQALLHYQKALAIRREMGDRLYLAQTLHNIGKTYHKQNDHQQALDYYRQTLTLRKKMKHQQGIISVMNDLGNSFRDRHQTDKALEHYLAAIERGRAIGEDYFTGLCSRKAGQIYIERGETTRGIDLLNRSLEKGQKLHNLELIKNAYHALFKAHKQERPKKALEYYIQYSQSQDSIDARQNDLRIMETQMNFELSKKQDEIQKIEKQVDKLALEKQLKDLELNRQKNIQYFLVIIIVLVIIAVVLFYNRYRLKKKTNALLEERYDQLRQANRKLTRSEQELRKANATKDKFFSIIAHDLRNPFNALYGLTEHISKNYKSHSREELQEFIHLIHESAEQLLNLLENLLYWSRTQRGKIPFNPANLNLKQLASNTLELLQITAQEKNLTVTTDLRHQSPAYGDEEMVTTILRNLLSNAIKFSWEGGHIVLRSKEQEHSLRIEVEDNGKGISRHNKDKLFRVDESFSSAGTRQEKGTGLGLILCKEFVEKHGGKIWAESEENQGSCFIFTLPLREHKNRNYDETTD